MATFLALYTGQTVGEAQMLAVSANTELVSYVAVQLLDDMDCAKIRRDDPVLREMRVAQKRALRLVAQRKNDDALTGQDKRKPLRQRHNQGDLGGDGLSWATLVETVCRERRTTRPRSRWFDTSSSRQARPCWRTLSAPR